MKQKIILSSVLLLSTCNLAFAGAWVNPKGKYELTIGGYYSLPSSSNEFGTLSGTPDVDYKIKSENSRISQTNELTYGLTKDGTLVLLTDVGYVSDKYRPILSNGEEFSISTDYFNAEAAFGYRHRLYEDNLQVISLQGLLYTGDISFGDNDTLYSKGSQAYSLALQYGRNFQYNFDFGFWKQTPSANRYHYFEAIGEAKHYPRVGQTEWNGEFHFGLSMTNKFRVIAGMYTSFNGVSINRSPLDSSEIASKVNATSLDAGQRAELISLLESRRNDKSSSWFHQLDLKLEYQAAKNGVVFIEGLSSIIIDKPFKNNSLLVGYEAKF